MYYSGTEVEVGLSDSPRIGWLLFGVPLFGHWNRSLGRIALPGICGLLFGKGMRSLARIALPGIRSELLVLVLAQLQKP